MEATWDEGAREATATVQQEQYPGRYRACGNGERWQCHYKHRTMMVHETGPTENHWHLTAPSEILDNGLVTFAVHSG